jgi:hypothetical protein
MFLDITGANTTDRLSAFNVAELEDEHSGEQVFAELDKATREATFRRSSSRTLC